MTARDSDDRNRQRRYDRVVDQIRACQRCGPEMNKANETQAAPGRGCLRSPVMIVGQSLCTKCMKSQVLFDGGCGLMLDEALGQTGRPPGRTKDDVFITNVVHCHPPNNRKSLKREKENCSGHLRAELAIVSPRLLIGLGDDARDALRLIYPKARELAWEPFALPRTAGVALETRPSISAAGPSCSGLLYQRWITRFPTSRKDRTNGRCAIPPGQSDVVQALRGTSVRSRRPCGSCDRPRHQTPARRTHSEANARPKHGFRHTEIEASEQPYQT